MSAFPSVLLGVLLLADPESAERIEVAVEIVERDDEDLNARVLENAKEAERLRITAERGDFDRGEGVVLFEGNAAVDYSSDYYMRSERIFAFFKGSNELDRIVATGRVSITNGNRVGTCETAVFRRTVGEVEMFGAADGTPARLSENGLDSLAGRRIRFWIDAEQVEVSDSEISFAKGVKKVGSAVKGKHE